MVSQASSEIINRDQIAQLIRDFWQLQLAFEATLPKQLAQVRNRLDALPPVGKRYRGANDDLFFRASELLCQKGNLSMGELSRALAVPLSTATRVVNWLVVNGYAQRLPDRSDRRIVRVTLTKTGQRLHKLATNYIAERMGQLLSNLTEEERTTFFALFRKLGSALKSSGQGGSLV